MLYIQNMSESIDSLQSLLDQHKEIKDNMVSLVSEKLNSELNVTIEEIRLLVDGSHIKKDFLFVTSDDGSSAIEQIERVCNDGYISVYLIEKSNNGNLIQYNSVSNVVEQLCQDSYVTITFIGTDKLFDKCDQIINAYSVDKI